MIKFRGALVALIFAAVAGSSATAATPSACPGTQQNLQKNRVAGLLGGLGEGLLTNQLNKMGVRTDGRFRSTMRALLTDGIACSLSEREQQQAVDAQTQALNSGRIGTASKTSWKSGERSSVGGGTVVLSRSKSGDQNCAVTRTLITDENGEEKSVEKESCQGPDGAWA